MRHVRWKHGEHTGARCTTLTRAPSGAVHALLVEPKTTTVGAATVALRCARPESLHTASAEAAHTPACVSRSVAPASDTAAAPASRATASHTSRSLAVPHTAIR